MNTVTFPGLGLTLHLNRVAFSIGDFHVYWYGIIIACGLLLAVAFCLRQRKHYGISEDDLMDCILCGIPCGIIGARLYYVIFYLDLFRDADGKFNWGKAVAIWDGGLAIYGAVIAVVILAVIMAKRKGFKLCALTDLVVMGLLIGQIVGRWGNFMNREAFGAETDIFCRMGLIAPDGSTIYVHPTFLYESLWNLCILIFLIIFERKGKRRYDGQCITLYFLLYGIGRTWIEGLRTDSLYIGATNIRVSQVLSIALVIIALAYLIIQGRREHPPEKLYVNMRAAQETTEPNGGEEQTEADNETEEK